MSDLTQLLNEVDALSGIVSADGELPGAGCPVCEALVPNYEALRDTLLQMDWRLNNMRPADDLAQPEFVKVQTLLARALTISRRMAGL